MITGGARASYNSLNYFSKLSTLVYPTLYSHCHHCGMASRPTFESVKQAAARIKGPVKVTPVLTCTELNRRSGKELYFKSEHLQSTGAFKVRGALNAVTRLAETSPQCAGVVTHSSGNHGQALAWAATKKGLPCTIVVPEGSPTGKVEAIRGYGAQLVFCTPTPEGRRLAVEKIVEETGMVFISPFDHPDVLAGQGTISMELLEQVPDLDTIVCAASGGGLSSGIAIAAKAIKPDIKIILVTPEGKMLEECLTSGERKWPNPPQFLRTIAEAIKMQQLGHNTFPILCDLAEKDVIEVSDEEMIEGMKLSFHWMKQVVESAAGATIAACLTDKFRQLPHIHKVGVIICGGNVDINNLPWTSTFKSGY